jgi:hypothetical protein
VVDHFGVTRVVSLGAVPMAVPHTRPIAVTPHANRPELVTGESPWQGELRVPASAQALLEIRLGEWGHAAMGYVAHIPHYLAQMEYPQAAVVLLEQLEIGGRLVMPVGGKDIQQLTLATKQADGTLAIREIMPVRFTQLEVD